MKPYLMLCAVLAGCTYLRPGLVDHDFQPEPLHPKTHHFPVALGHKAHATVLHHSSVPRPVYVRIAVHGPFPPHAYHHLLMRSFEDMGLWQAVFTSTPVLHVPEPIRGPARHAGRSFPWTDHTDRTPDTDIHTQYPDALIADCTLYATHPASSHALPLGFVLTVHDPATGHTWFSSAAHSKRLYRADMAVIYPVLNAVRDWLAAPPPH